MMDRSDGKKNQVRTSSKPWKRGKDMVIFCGMGAPENKGSKEKRKLVRTLARGTSVKKQKRKKLSAAGGG